MKSNKEYMESILNKVDNYKLRQKRRNRVILSSLCGLFLVVGISTVGLKKDIVNDIITSDNLPRFESEQQLLSMLKTNDEYRKQEMTFGNMVFDTVAEDMALSTNSVKAEANKEMESSDDSFSETNTQVQGVDESDIVKTNGDYIYYLSNNVLRVFETKTADTKLIKEIELKGDRYTYASELYINDDYIVVIASGRIASATPIMEKQRLMVDYVVPYYGEDSTKALIYNINTYELEREIEIDGNYVSSRKVDNNFYIVTNKYINTYKELTREDIVPLYKDTAVNKEYLEIAVTDIRYFPDFDKKDCSYMLISSFNLDKIDNEVDI